jgi:uncharacterized protein (TIGR02001 family)
MNKTSSPLAVVALVLGVSPLWAQTPAPTPAVPAAPAAPTASWTLTPAFASQYMFRGVRLGGPAFEPTVECDYGNLALGVWANFPIADKVPGQSDPEIDPYGSYKFTINDAFSIQPGFTWYTYVNAEKGNGFYKSTFEPNIAVNYTVSGLTLTPKLYYDMVLKGPTAELNAAYAVPLKDLGTELDFSGTLGTYKWTDASAIHNPDTKNYGNYWLAGVAAPFQINKQTKLTLGWAYTKGSDNFFKTGSAGKAENTAAVGRGVVTVSLAFSF